MQNCLVEIKCGFISVYRLSLDSLKLELVFHKNIEYYKKINELLIARYIFSLKAVLEEVLSRDELGFVNSVRVRIFLENNTKVKRELSIFLKEFSNVTVEFIDKNLYRLKMLKTLNRGVLKFWEDCETIYVGYYRNGIYVVNEFISLFEGLDKLNKEDISKRFIYFDFPKPEKINYVSIDITDKRVRSLLVYSTDAMGYN